MEPNAQDAVLGGQNSIHIDEAMLGGLEALKLQYEQGSLPAGEILRYGHAGVSWLASIINWKNVDALERILQQNSGLPLCLQRDATVKVDGQGQIIERSTAQNLAFKESLGQGVELELMAIREGRFLMGSPEEEKGRVLAEGPQHWVDVPPFLMGKYPITQAQWRMVAALPKVQMKLDRNPSFFEGDNRPVEDVSWDDAVEFCERLSAYTGRTYRLPSEAEWEYACRAGTTTPFHFGETITKDLAHYDSNPLARGESIQRGDPRPQTTPVGHFGIANAFGLCDMHGNVEEWCLDHWSTSYEGAPVDGSAWLNHDKMSFHDNPMRYILVCDVSRHDLAQRVIRGGSWSGSPSNCRSANRRLDAPACPDSTVGFRVVCDVSRVL